MNTKLISFFCVASLAVLAGANPAVAGEVSFGFGFGYSSYPAYGYFGYHAVPPTFVYRALPRPYLYGPPVAAAYYYAPYRYRVAAVHRHYPLRCRHGRHYGHCAPRRYVRH